MGAFVLSVSIQLVFMVLILALAIRAQRKRTTFTNTQVPGSRRITFPAGAAPGVVHLAGDMDPELGQHCLVCGKQLTKPDTGLMVRDLVPKGSQAAPATRVVRAWHPGALVLVDGLLSMDVSDWDEQEIAPATRCSVERDPVTLS